MSHLLVIRNSAMGDVALTVPAVRAVLAHYRELKITMVSNRNYAAFFDGIERLTFFGTDFNSHYKGMGGVFQLGQDLRKIGPFDAVLDLHSVIRSWMLSAQFSLLGVPVFRIDKGKRAKKKLTRKHHKVRQRLKPSYQRYADVFARAGFPLVLGEGPWLGGNELRKQHFEDQNFLPKDKVWIGVAPYAQHQGKMWPEAKSEQLIQSLSEAGYFVFLFGGGKTEAEKLEKLAAKYQFVNSLASKFSLAEELNIMSRMDLMVTMDSSNLHMGSLVGTPVVSIWGATHSFGGFEPLGENKDRIVELDPEVLTCRPCSVFGKKPCFRGDYACLNWIEVKDVQTKIQEILKVTGLK